MKILIILILNINIVFSQIIYVSPNGNDSNSGKTKNDPVKHITTAAKIAVPGTKILLMYDSYKQQSEFKNINGDVDNPIIIESESQNPDSFAVIDLEIAPTADIDETAITISNSSWIEIRNINFRNCWTDVIFIEKSSYISVKGCKFEGGKRVIKPVGKYCHHFLVENCYWEQHEGVWSEFDWEEMHHGSLSYYNGSLFHPDNTDGCFVIRNNIVKNVFNAFRTAFESELDRDANGEYYKNLILNSRDNVFEPEGSAHNLFFYHNVIHNSHKPFSIDGLKGGPLYIFGNVVTQDNDDYTKSLTTGIWKFKNGPLTEPCYAFNNSFYTRAKAFKEGEATNQQMKHFNNIYYFFEGSDRLRLRDWHSSFEFDYDCINQNWPDNIINNAQEKNGIIADAKFVNGPGRNLKLENDSPCINSGKIISIEKIGWTQSFEGSAPDIGAYDNNKLVEGPAFRYSEPTGWLKTFDEKPRIVKHKIVNNHLRIFFSYPIFRNSISIESVLLFHDSLRLNIVSSDVSEDGYILDIISNTNLVEDKIRIDLQPKPIGQNGETMTFWASTILQSEQMITDVKNLQTNFSKRKSHISVYPNPFNLQTKIIIESTEIIEHARERTLDIYNINGEKIASLTGSMSENKMVYLFNGSGFSSGIYFLSARINNEILSHKFLLIK